jgi:fluoride exporter
MRVCIIVGIGGFLGTVCRYLLTLIPISNKSGFPVVTLLINVIGALLIGVLAALAAKYKGVNADLMTFLRVGICGGFTTFSTFALEISNLFGAGKTWMGILYISLSLILSLLAVSLGKVFVA